MFCLKCGAWLPEDANYCSSCGDPTKPSNETPMTEPSSDNKIATPSSNPATEAANADPSPSFASCVPLLFFEEENENFTKKRPRIPFVIPKSNEPLRFSGLFGSLLLLALPVFGFFSAVVWSLGGSRNRNRITLGKAALATRGLLLVLLAAIIGVLYVFFRPVFENLLAWIQTFPA